jgi:hypothetical protein
MFIILPSLKKFANLFKHKPIDVLAVICSNTFCRFRSKHPLFALWHETCTNQTYVAQWVGFLSLQPAITCVDLQDVFNVWLWLTKISSDCERNTRRLSPDTGSLYTEMSTVTQKCHPSPWNALVLLGWRTWELVSQFNLERK